MHRSYRWHRYTFLVDTPGFSSLYIENMEEQELKTIFPNLKNLPLQCRFLECRHLKEPDCAVKAALGRGEISRLRYEKLSGLISGTERKKEILTKWNMIVPVDLISRF